MSLVTIDGQQTIPIVDSEGGGALDPGLLADGAVFTSPIQVILGFSRIVGMCSSDLTGDIQIQQSVDGVNWDEETIFYVLAKAPGEDAVAAWDIQIDARYVRFVYTNVTGSGAQTHFRIICYARPVE